VTVLTTVFGVGVTVVSGAGADVAHVPDSAMERTIAAVYSNAVLLCIDARLSFDVI
jgi:hypothetical protein